MPYEKVITDEEYTAFTEDQSPGVVIVKASTAWCGPCKAIAPFFKELSNEYKDIDDCQQVAQDLNISSLPIFVVLKEGNEVERFSGANQTKLQEMVEKFLG